MKRTKKSKGGSKDSLTDFRQTRESLIARAHRTHSHPPHKMVIKHQGKPIHGPLPLNQPTNNAQLPRLAVTARIKPSRVRLHKLPINLTTFGASRGEGSPRRESVTEVSGHRQPSKRDNNEAGIAGGNLPNDGGHHHRGRRMMSKLVDIAMPSSTRHHPSIPNQPLAIKSFPCSQELMDVVMKRGISGERHWPG
uniref:Uncharacterized protein n=1 Tax=Arundo donax TaxID=35708 RepID=A0A0A8XWQ5_ARUDO